MKRLLTVLTLVAVLLPVAAQARKVTYIADNHRFNFVRLQEVKPKVLVQRNMTHPEQLDEQGVRAALASVMLSRAYIIKKETDSQQVFDQNAIDFLAPNLVRAFAQAKPNEEVQFGYLMKQPIFILRNDRLNLGSAWLSGSELHIKFDKLYAKVTGDTDKRGNEDKAVAKAIGLRVRLEMGPGQKMGIEDPEEVVLDINYNYALDNLNKEKKTTPILKTMSGDTAPIPADIASKSSDPTSTVATEETKSKKGKKVKADQKAVATTETPTAVPAVKSTQERLQQLDDLKKQGLINKKEYDQKRQEILKDL